MNSRVYILFALFAGAAFSQNNVRTKLSSTMLGSLDLQTSEVPINALYIPHTGFDDNDNIEFLIEGLLPNACYGISEKPRLEVSFGNFHVRQIAYRKTEGPCSAPDTALKGILANPVPFDDVVKLGQLQKGDYKIFFQTTEAFRSRVFTVKAAPTDNIDSLNYARVENAYVPTRSYAGSTVRIVVQAAIISNCMKPSKEFRIAPDDNPADDILVILPEVEVSKDELCLPTYEPFEQVVSINGLRAGRYQLHVRSFNGASINRIFNVY
jgi:hypothetical protein